MRRREAGFALLIVLWSLVLLSLVLTQLLSAGRSEAQLAGNLRAASTAEAVADAGVAEAVFHLLARGAQAWPAHGVHTVRVGRGVADVRIENTAGKVNPNTASPPLLRALIAQCGRSDADAVRLARAILLWRSAPDDAPDGEWVNAAAYRAAGLGYAPPSQPFQSEEEVGLTLGMTPATYDCLAPHLSLYQPGEPSLRTDDPLIARALAVMAQQGGLVSRAAEGDPVVVIVTSTGSVAGGQFVRRATVQLTPDVAGSPFRILKWEAGA